jgi:glyoxylate reductase
MGTYVCHFFFLCFHNDVLSQLASVGLDVFPDEPNVDPRLLEFPQVALLPHVGTRTQDTEKKMELRALGNLKDFLLTGSGKDLVPELR